MSKFKLLYFVIFIINSYHVNAQISDKRLCGDENCIEPVAYAKTLLRYSSPDVRILSFSPNEDVIIYSKAAGNRIDLWGAEIRGKRGYIPKHLVRETKVLKKATILVETEIGNDEVKPVQVPSMDKLEPDKVQEAFQVIDGTTLYVNPEDPITPSSTESPIEPTAIPEIRENKSSEEPTEVDSANQETFTLDKLDDLNKSELLGDGKRAVGYSDDDDDDDDDEDDYVEDDDRDDEEEDQNENDKRNETSADYLEPTTLIKEAGASLPADKETPSNEETLEIPIFKLNESAEEAPEESNENIENDMIKEHEVEHELNQIGDVVVSDVPQEIPTTEIPLLIDEEIKIGKVPISLAISSDNDDNNITSVIDADPELNNSNLSEIIEDSSSEVTTIASEIESPPQPFDLGIEDVTPNPVEVDSTSTSNEEIKTESVVPTLPPLGLFNSFSGEVTTSQEMNENVIKDLPSENITKSLMNEELTLNDTEDKINEDLTSNGTEDEINEEITTFSKVPQIVDELPSQEVNVQDNREVDDSPGFISNILSFFGGGSDDDGKREAVVVDTKKSESPNLESLEIIPFEKIDQGKETLLNSEVDNSYCDADPVSCKPPKESAPSIYTMDLIFAFNPDIFLYLITTAISVVVFLFGYIAFDKRKREGSLVAKINKLEKELLITIKENQMLQDNLSGDGSYSGEPSHISNVILDELKGDLQSTLAAKSNLEEQIQSLEKELENSTELGLELNRMLTEILNSQSGSDVLKTNVEHLQRQLIEQQGTINSSNETLALASTENHELKLEVELSNKKVLDLQTELDKMCLNVLKIEEEKDQQQSLLESEVASYKTKFEQVSQKLTNFEENRGREVSALKEKLDQAEHNLDFKINELALLKDSVKEIRAIKNNSDGVLQKLLSANEIKAELQTLKFENKKFTDKLQREIDAKNEFEKRAKAAAEEAQRLREKYDQVDKLKAETQTKLEVLQNYFKDKEAQLQREINKHESLWAEKRGEATSTTERIKFMQDQLQSYKAQNESLKQEIMSQEVELKSQILVLEKKAHENWVSARQAERKLEDAKQEAAQLRHRLTLRERTFQEDKSHNRLESPLDQNGDIPLSPLHVESPPLLYGGRDHMTQSPPLTGLPPFLPPPPGVPFIPPPMPGVPPFIPPPAMFPGDHRPPPLGRMSSPPINSRYSPSSRGYSPYDDRNSSSPSDSEYGMSPPHRRGYNHYSDRRDYKRTPANNRSNGRNKGISSGSGNSNESLEKASRSQSKV